MKTDPIQEPGLPDDLASELRMLAATETAGTRPFPGVDAAVRRRRVTRYGRGAALVGAVAAAVVAVEVLAGGVFDQADHQGAPAAPTTGVTAPATDPDQAGYGSATGPLAADRAWVTGLQNRIKDSITPDRGGTIVASEIRLVSAGDIGDRARYAVVLIPEHRSGQATDSWRRDIWLGPAGAGPARMRFQGGSDFEASVPVDREADFFSIPKADDTGKAVAVVVAPGARQVRIASSRRWLPDGSTPSQTRDLQPTDKGVWTTALTPDEYLLSDYSVDGETGNSATSAPGPDFGPVAPAGTDPDLLSPLDGSWNPASRGTTAMVPVYAQVLAFGRHGHLAGGVLRSPDNGFQVTLTVQERRSGSVDTTHFSQITDQEFADLGHVMAATVAIGAERQLVVLAPEGATQVRVGNRTAKVVGRLAAVDVAYPDLYRKVEALDASGKVIATVTARDGDGTVTEPE